LNRCKGCLEESGSSWVTLHCKGLGSSDIYFDERATYTIGGWPNDKLVGATINQIGRSVGGYVIPVNKLEVLSPYLALAGLIAAITILTVKIRKERLSNLVAY